MEEIDVPPYFLCPISLQIMRDPVTVSTGITYDRENIEKWIFSSKNSTCPVTKQALSDCDLTPNHTLRRLIQSWCTLHASYGVERFPTPKPAITKSEISKILKEIKYPSLQLKPLQRLKSIANQSEASKRCIVSAGAIETLTSVIINSTQQDSSSGEFNQEHNKVTDEALSLLNNLHISKESLKQLLSNVKFLESLTIILRRGSYESRAYTVMLLKSMFEEADSAQIVALNSELFIELAQMLRDQISYQATKATLLVLIEICRWGRNKIKAVEAGLVNILVESLLDTSEKRPCEMMLTVLDQLCGCAEGRAELLSHGAGLAVVSKKILRVSQVASERAVRILFWISKFSATPAVLQDMLQFGVVAKLCLVLQVEYCGNKTSEKAKEILKLHARVWKNSPCVPTSLIVSYP
ncbi:U-box domain [Dillenia turbinata]|uniref:U-box domain-containing protein n=1 Tax=Dillenia turbinata TaxID=194707 RepID=A0AAN8VY52_9MAGN